MTTTPVAVRRPSTTQVHSGGHSEVVMFAPVTDGGLIVNPSRAADQGLASAEVLFVDLTGPAATHETATTVPIQPGGTFSVPAGQAVNVSVNAVHSGHQFSAIQFGVPPPFPPIPQTGDFPPSGPTSLTVLSLPSYLYKEYDDDESLQAFVFSWNGIVQTYLDWFVIINLPVYIGDQISGALLDWVAAGLYGMTRPALSSNRNRDIGPVNTWGPNQFIPLNARERIGPVDVVYTSDDVFKRIMTWNFYKGDGPVFNIRWLKRRIKRFLIGVNGTAPNIEDTYSISVTLGDKFLTIRIGAGARAVIGGALPNRFGPNSFVPLGSFILSYTSPLDPTHYPLENVFKEAMENDVLQMPFQYQVAVII